MKRLIPILLCAAAILCGCEKDHEEIYIPPTPHIVSADADFTLETEVPVKVRIYDNSTGSRVVYSFGDNKEESYSLPVKYAITHKYSNPGTYIVTAKAYGSDGSYKEKKQTITLKKPKVYIRGIEYRTIYKEGQYYKAILQDDDFITTTWLNTTYSPILYSSSLPYQFILSTPKELSGLSDDDYYTLIIRYNSKASGDGTQCLKQTISTSTILYYWDYIEVSNNEGSHVVRLLMGYE